MLALIALAGCAAPPAPPAAPEPAEVEPPPGAPHIDSHPVARHTCLLDPAGRALCWGRNADGQLGDGTFLQRAGPVAVAGGIRWRRISVGGHTCGITADGRALCWGPNDEGQLGTGGTARSAVPAPVAAPAAAEPPRWTHIAAGGAHTCALDEQGRAWCWGDNRYGQLGDGTGADHPLPVRVALDRPLAAISVGDRHTCALTDIGEALCWGDASLGQLGEPGRTGSALRPRTVPGTPELVEIAAGRGHSCGHTREGQLWCWGQNGIGQLGIGAPPAPFPPTALEELPPIAGVSLGYHHTCARDTSGRVHCWGGNIGSRPGPGISGQLGSDVSWSNLPVALPAPDSVARLAAGDAHTCALTSDGSVWCWGANDDGQLGTAPSQGGPTPRRITLPTP